MSYVWVHVKLHSASVRNKGDFLFRSQYKRIIHSNYNNHQCFLCHCGTVRLLESVRDKMGKMTAEEVAKKLELYKTLEPLIVNFALDTKAPEIIMS